MGACGATTLHALALGALRRPRLGQPVDDALRAADSCRAARPRRGASHVADHSPRAAAGFPRRSAERVDQRPADFVGGGGGGCGLGCRSCGEALTALCVFDCG